MLISCFHKTSSLGYFARTIPRTQESKANSLDMDLRLVCLLLLPMAMSLPMEDRDGGNSSYTLNFTATSTMN